MILFKDLKQGNSVHFFNRKNAKYEQGIIASDPSLPHFQAGQTTMIVDVAITVGSETKTYSIPETLSTTYYGDMCISTDIASVLREIDQLANQADAAISAMPSWEEIKEKCSELRDTLNPGVKEKKLMDQRMTKIESNMSDMKDMMRKFMERFTTAGEAAGTVATVGTVMGNARC